MGTQMSAFDWRSSDAYERAQSAEITEFAWECLRRNPDFQRDRARLDAAARALDSHPEDSVSAVITAVDETLTLFRDRACKIGRARIFADRSVGLDDPGMVAFRVMVGALKRN